MYKIGILFFVLCCSVAKAQQDTAAIIVPVTVYKDPRIDILEKKQLELNTNYIKALSRSAMGFRLQVLSTNDRGLAMKTKTELLQKFPEQKNYMIYQAPYVKLRFGNFRTRDEAEVYKKQISKMLNSTSVYLIEERIEIKPEKENEPE